MNRPNSTVRRWIGIGKRKWRWRDLEQEMEGTPKQVAVEGSMRKAIESPPEKPAPEKRPTEHPM